MKASRIAILVLTWAISVAAFAQYGLVDNYEGNDRFGANLNLTEGVNGTFGSAGGGEGSGIFGFGGDLSAGYAGYAMDIGAGASGADITQTINGMSTSAYTIDFKDVEADGDTFIFKVETGDASNGEQFIIGPLATTDTQTLTFTVGSGTPIGTFNPAHVTKFVFLANTLNGGFGINLDNVGFMSDLVPDSGNVDDFESYAIGSSTAPGDGFSSNTFGGAIMAFAYGAGSITSEAIVDLGGNQAFQASFAGGSPVVEGGVLMDLGPLVGSQTDVSAFNALSVDLAVGSDDVGTSIVVFLETIDVANYGERCYGVITPTDTLATYEIRFADLVCPAVPFDPAKIHRITFVQGSDNGNSQLQLTIDNVAFVNSVDSPPIPFVADFNDQTPANNYGGTTYGIYGGGDPYFQNDSAVAHDYTVAGASGGLGDYGWRAYGLLPQGPNWTFFGTFIGLRFDLSGVDISGFAELSFDIKAGTGTAHNTYDVRLEDTDGTTEYNNTVYAIPDLTTTYQTFTIPLDHFAGGAQPVDLTKVKTIVFNARNAPGGTPSSNIEMDLYLDNVTISGTNSSVTDWRLFE
jgi:hypothetical protein